MSFQELLTCVRERIPVTAVVFHNGQWVRKRRTRWTSTAAVSSAAICRTRTSPSWRARWGGRPAGRARRPGRRCARPKAQSEGKTTVLEMMVSQELGDPFRRDALKQPVRFLQKYQPMSTSPSRRGNAAVDRAGGTLGTGREDGRGPGRVRKYGCGLEDPGAGIRRGLPICPRLAPGGAGRCQRAARRQQERERWRAMDYSRRCAMPGCRRPAAHGGGVSLVRVQPGRGVRGARRRLYRAGAGGAHRAAAGGMACRPAGWKSSTRLTTSWNRRGPRRRWRATAPWAC